MTDLASLGREKYVSVTTFKRDGTAVPTPVWVAGDGPDLLVWTAAESGKVKRIRNNPRVTVAPCDVRGNLRGEPVPARAEVLPPEAADALRGNFVRKYGLSARLAMFGSRLRRGRRGTVVVRITPVA